MEPGKVEAQEWTAGDPEAEGLAPRAHARSHRQASREGALQSAAAAVR